MDGRYVCRAENKGKRLAGSTEKRTVLWMEIRCNVAGLQHPLGLEENRSLQHPLEEVV
jgi:hypothetical protein